MSRILIVEDHPDMASGIRANLEIEGYAVEVAGDGRRGLELAREVDPDLIILDLTLPELDGFTVLRTLRGEGFKRPVLVLSAHGEEMDKVHGFRLGADQYVTKPFSPMELLARVEGLLRRTEDEEDNPQRLETLDGITIDKAARTVVKDGEQVALTHREFDVLVHLIRNRGQVVSRLDLLSNVWGHVSAVTTRTVDSHIAAIRRKLERDPSNPQYIQTVRKIGYRIDA